MNNVSGPHPGKDHNAGDVWYNTNDETFYIFDGFYWRAARDGIDGLVEDLAKEIDDPLEAYDRAMSIL